MEPTKCPRCGGNHWNYGWPISGIACGIKSKLDNSSASTRNQRPGNHSYPGISSTLPVTGVESGDLYIHGEQIKNPIEISGAPYALRIVFGIFVALTIFAVLAGGFALIQLHDFIEVEGTFSQFTEEHPVYHGVIQASGFIIAIFVFIFGVKKIFSGRKVPASIFCNNCHNIINDVNLLRESYEGGICWLCGSSRLSLISLKKSTQLINDDMIVNCRHCGYLGDFVIDRKNHCVCPICRKGDRLALTEAEKIDLDKQIEKLELYFIDSFKKSKDSRILWLCGIGLVDIEDKYIKGEPVEWDLGLYYPPTARVEWDKINSSIGIIRVEVRHFLANQLATRRISRNKDGNFILDFYRLPNS